MGSARGLAGLQQLSLEDWVLTIAPAALSLSPEAIARSANLEVVADALTMPSTQVQGRLVFETPAEQAASMIGRLLRGRAVAYREHEVAVATAREHLALNAYGLAIPGGEAKRFHRLLEGVSAERRGQTALAKFLDRYIVLVDGPCNTLAREKLLVYVSLPERALDGEGLRGAYDEVDAAARAAATDLPEPVDLATTSPGLIARDPEDAWEARRRLLHGGDPEALGGEAHWASGMIALGFPGDTAAMGFELAHLGRRCPALWLSPQGVPVPSVVAGYARDGGSVYLRSFGNATEMSEHVRAFVRHKAVTMLERARERHDAALASTLRQLPLRHKLEGLSPEEMTELLARTNFRPAYADQLAHEPAEFSRAERGDLHKLAHELEIPTGELAQVEAAPRLSHVQERALSLAVRQRELPGEEALRLRARGERLLSRSQGSVSLTAPEDWEELITRRSHV